MSRVSNRRLSAAAFLRLRPWLVGIDVRRVQAAYYAMVLGRRQTDIAKEYKWTQQAVAGAVATIWNRVEEAVKAGFDPLDESPADTSAVLDTPGLIPDGWVATTIIAPPELLERFKAEIAAYIHKQPSETIRPPRSKKI
jgi:hypothetical protein